MFFGRLLYTIPQSFQILPRHGGYYVLWAVPLGSLSGLLYVYADDPVEKALETMLKYGVRRLLVLEQNGDLLGVMSLRDLAKFCKLSI